MTPPLVFWTPDSSQREFKTQVKEIENKFYVGEWSDN